MNNPNNFRKKVYHMAWQLVFTTGKSWPVCLAKAWSLHRFMQQMENETIAFAYEKADGSLRKARGTLINSAEKTKGTGKENHKVIRYYDVDANAFRSFRIENFITTY